MNTFIVGREGEKGRELSTRLAGDPTKHLSSTTSRNAEPPQEVKVSQLPLELESERLIYDKKTVIRKPTDI